MCMYFERIFLLFDLRRLPLDEDMTQWSAAMAMFVDRCDGQKLSCVLESVFFCPIDLVFCIHVSGERKYLGVMEA